MQGGERCAERGVLRVRRSERASAPTPQMDSFQRPADRPGIGGRVGESKVGLSRGPLRDHHGAGRLRMQPRRFVFLTSGRDGRAPDSQGERGYKGCHVPQPQ